MEDWARIHQRFVKTSNEVTKRGILTNGDYKKMVKFRPKRQKSAKMESSRVWPKANEITKRGILTYGDFTKMTNLEKNYFRFGKN